MAKSIQSLYRLFLENFVPAELRRIAACHYPDLANLLPGDLASGDTLAMEFASVLLRGGAVDARLFQMLAKERPRRSEEIEKVMEVYVPGGSLKSEQNAIEGKPKQDTRAEAERIEGTLAPEPQAALVIIDDSRLLSLAGDGELAEGVYVVLRNAGEETIEFVAEPAFERRASLMFHGSIPTSLVPLWSAGARVDLGADDPAWRLTNLPLGDEFLVKSGCRVAIRAGRVEHGWLLRYLRTEGRPTYYFVLLSVRR